MFLRSVFIALAAIASCHVYAQQAAKVESKGQHAQIKVEEVISGHLTELNGRYKLRVTEVTWDPGGQIGPHHHVGPGVRCVTSGELTYVSDTSHTYRPGDCFYESGDVSHTANNLTSKPVVLLSFEVVPAAYSGGTAIPVPK